VILPAAKSAAIAGEKKTHRLAIHIDQNDAEVMKLALNNARNVYDLYKERGEEVAIELVTYSQGLHMLREDTSPVKEKSGSCARPSAKSPSRPATIRRPEWKSGKESRCR